MLCVQLFEEHGHSLYQHIQRKGALTMKELVIVLKQVCLPCMPAECVRSREKSVCVRACMGMCSFSPPKPLTPVSVNVSVAGDACNS